MDSQNFSRNDHGFSVVTVRSLAPYLRNLTDLSSRDVSVPTRYTKTAVEHGFVWTYVEISYFVM